MRNELFKRPTSNPDRSGRRSRKIHPLQILAGMALGASFVAGYVAAAYYLAK